LATAAERLVEAEAAYHALQTGKAVARVRDSNGDEVTYTTATVSRLRQYINDLKAEIAGALRVAKPLRPVFNFR
jgi:hypothetical protein